MATDADGALRKELIAALKGGNAHATFEDVVGKFPEQLRGVKEGAGKGHLPYSAWQLLEHIRRAQDDILRFSRNHDGSYKEMKWPDDYWPKDPTPPSAAAWDKSIAAVQADRDALVELVRDTKQDLVAAFPWGDGQNLLREVLLVIDHNSYHVGELLALRRMLGIWPAK